MIWVLLGLGQAMEVSGDLERTERVYGELLEIVRRAGDDAQVARALNNIGTLLLIRGDKARGRRLLEEALAIARPRHDKWLTSLVTGSLGQALAPEDPGT